MDCWRDSVDMHVDIGIGLNHGVQSSVICINGKSCVGEDAAFGIVDVQ